MIWTAVCFMCAFEKVGALAFPVGGSRDPVSSLIMVIAVGF